MLWHKLSELPFVTIAKIRGRARGADSELALACDMRFAARGNAILGQIEVGCGALPGAGGVQHLARLMGRSRAMEAILGSDDRTGRSARRSGLGRDHRSRRVGDPRASLGPRHPGAVTRRGEVQ